MIRPMTTLLVADSHPWGSVFGDWIPLLAICGALAAPFIAGYFTRKGARKSRYEQLNNLVDTYNKWPDSIAGKSSIKLAIKDLVAEVRVDTDEEGRSGVSKGEYLSEVRARRKAIDRTLLGFPLPFAIFWLAADLFDILVLNEGGFQNRLGQILLPICVLGLMHFIMASEYGRLWFVERWEMRGYRVPRRFVERAEKGESGK